MLVRFLNMIGHGFRGRWRHQTPPLMVAVSTAHIDGDRTWCRTRSVGHPCYGGALGTLKREFVTERLGQSRVTIHQIPSLSPRPARSHSSAFARSKFDGSPGNSFSRLRRWDRPFAWKCRAVLHSARSSGGRRRSGCEDHLMAIVVSGR
jgi:hypothetical protein